jgi:hypothetical protein
MRADAGGGSNGRDEAELDRLVWDAVTQSRELVVRLKAERDLISYHYDYPSLERFDSGQPRVTHGKGPLDYAGVFSFAAPDAWSVSLDDVPVFGELGRLVAADENLRARLLPRGLEQIEEWGARFAAASAARIPLEILDRLMNTVGEDFSDEDFDAAWVPMRNGLMLEALPVEIVVPVCLATFQTRDQVVLAGRVRVEPNTGGRAAGACSQDDLGCGRTWLRRRRRHAFGHDYRLRNPWTDENAPAIRPTWFLPSRGHRACV